MQNAKYVISFKVRLFKYSSRMNGRIVQLFDVIEGNGNFNGVMEITTEKMFVAMVNQRRKPTRDTVSPEAIIVIH